MSIEEHVTNLELSKKLKDAGVKQESIWYWHKPFKDKQWIIVGYNKDLRVCENLCSAFTSSELGALLPINIKSVKCSKKGWWVFYSKNNVSDDCAENGTWSMYEADARAEMIIFLLENKKIDSLIMVDGQTKELNENILNLTASIKILNLLIAKLVNKEEHQPEWFKYECQNERT